MTELNWLQIQKKPIKEMRKLDLKLWGSKHIRDDNGLTFFSVTGNQQSGKSAYGMCILAELYNFDEDAIMGQIVMTAKEFTEKIDDALTNKYRHRCIMWDDASVTGSAAKWMTDPKMVMYLAALGDTLAVATKAIILTSPSGDMTKAFRNYQKYIIQIGQGRNRDDKTAKAYFVGRSPMMQRWCRSVFADNFNVKVPFYLRYAKKREDLSLQAVKNMKQMFISKDTVDTEDKPITKAERATELVRDFVAGVYNQYDSLTEFATKFTEPAYGISYNMLCKQKRYV